MTTNSATASGQRITVVGAGIFGLWQALVLARAGHQVRVIERSAEPFSESASQYAGAMVSPYCEAEEAEPVVRDLGLEAAGIWRQHYDGLIENGSMVVASARDQSELRRFARETEGHETIGSDQIAKLEPDLGDRFMTALYYPDEAHMVTPAAMQSIMAQSEAAGARFTFGVDGNDDDVRAPPESDADIVIDCRGLAARDQLPTLRGVRGERLLIRSHDVKLNRPVRLLHPRYKLYAVPWGDGRILIGATLLESEDEAAMTVRSALELLGMAYALHPGFGEAEILEMSAGVRPSFPDNVPRVIVRGTGREIFVNGAYRHGFLLAPMLATVTQRVIGEGLAEHPLLVRQ